MEKPKILPVDGKRRIVTGAMTYSIELFYLNLSGEVIELARIAGGYVIAGKCFKSYHKAIEHGRQVLIKSYYL